MLLAMNLGVLMDHILQILHRLLETSMLCLNRSYGCFVFSFCSGNSFLFIHAVMSTK